MRIVITGAGGKLGSQLVAVLSPQHDVLGYGSRDLDITNFQFVKRVIQQIKPQLVINAAAWTDVDGCAQDPDRAILVNGIGAQNLAIASYENNAAILQISSNEVFDGQSKRAYTEYEQTNPVNSYGYSKFIGEKSVIQSNPRHYVVRTSWLFAHGGRNFIHVILDAAQAGKPLRIVIDEVANPTYNNDLAQAIAQLIETERYGIYHLSNEGTVSRYHFARYFLDKAGLSEVDVKAISRHEWQRPSTPPLYTSLANHSARSMGIIMRPWQAAVDDFLLQENLVVQAT